MRRAALLLLAAAACSPGRARAPDAPTSLPGSVVLVDAGPATPAGAVAPYHVIAVATPGTIAGRVVWPDAPAVVSAPSACPSPAPPAARAAVVWIDGIVAGKAPPAPPVPAASALRDCAFAPSLTLLARVDAPLALVNADPLRHEPTVETLAGAPRLLARVPMPLEGQRFLVTPGVPGPLRLGCALHPGEQGWAFVAGNPYVTVADDAGGFRLDGVPTGHHHLLAWSPPLGAGAAPLVGEATVDLAAGAIVTVDLPVAPAPALAPAH